MSGEPQYSEQDAEEILRLAAKKSSGSISRERLLQMADELGISPDAVSQAEDTVMRQRIDEEERKEFQIAHRRSFLNQLVSYVIINIGLVAFNLIDEHRITWSLWVIAAWGLSIAMQGVKAFLRTGDDYEREFEKWRARRRGGVSASVSNGPRIVANISFQGSELKDHLENLVLRDNLTKLEAIKQLRNETGIGLADAKNAVEAYEQQNPGSFHR